MGNKSSFIPATTDAKAGLAKGLERATAAIAKAPVHDWKRAEVDDGKNHWIVSGDAPRGGGLGDRGPASSALDAHIELEQAMAASRKRVSAPGEASDSSAYDSSSSSSSSASCRRRRKEKKEKGSKKSSSRKDDKRKKSKKKKGPQEGREATETATRGAVLVVVGFRDGQTSARLRGIREETQAQTGGIERAIGGGGAPPPGVPAQTQRDGGLESHGTVVVCKRSRVEDVVATMDYITLPYYTRSAYTERQLETASVASRLRRRRRNPARRPLRRRSQRVDAAVFPRRVVAVALS